MLLSKTQAHLREKMSHIDVSINSGWQSCWWGLCWKVLRLPGDEDIERTRRRCNRVTQDFLVIYTLVCHIMSEALWRREQGFHLCLPRADTIGLYCWLGFQGSTRIKMASSVFQGCNPHSRKFLLFAESFQTQNNNNNFSWKPCLWEAGWGRDALCVWHF